MTTSIISIERDQPLSDAYHALQGTPYQHIPVLDGDRPIGMLSSTDILRLVYDVEGASDKMLTSMLDHQFTIDDAMTTSSSPCRSRQLSTMRPKCSPKAPATPC